MIVRVVNMKCVMGMEEKLKELCLKNLVPVNEEAGCEKVYILEPSIEDGNPLFGIVSIWKDKNILNNMKNSEKYRSALQGLTPLVESIIDNVYVVAENNYNN